MPGAGQEDASVIAVTRPGDVFLGLNKQDPAQLGSRIRDRLASKTDKTIYLRVDARTKFQDFEKVIDAIRSAGGGEVELLTKRESDSPREEGPVQELWVGNPLLKSVGLHVSISSPLQGPAEKKSSRESAIVVHVIYRPNAAPAYAINGSDVARADLQSKLTEIFASCADRMMFVTGDDNLQFSDVAGVIDIAKASKIDHIDLITAALVTPGP